MLALHLFHIYVILLVSSQPQATRGTEKLVGQHRFIAFSNYCAVSVSGQAKHLLVVYQCEVDNGKLSTPENFEQLMFRA